MSPASERCRLFHELHKTGCFVIPNPWNAGSARLLVQLGFRALATTSSGYAWSRGIQDHRVGLNDALAYFQSISEAVDVPVSADFEAGFALDPSGVAKNVAAAAKTGIAGLSIEDSTGNRSQPLFELALAADRIRAARQALDEDGTGLLLTARSEGFISGRPDLDETIARLVAYRDAGADCLFAPGLPTLADIRQVVDAVAPAPVNVLGGDFATVRQLGESGVRRISVGGALARAAWSGFLEAATEIAEQGTFHRLTLAIAGAEMNRRFEE